MGIKTLYGNPAWACHPSLRPRLHPPATRMLKAYPPPQRHTRLSSAPLRLCMRTVPLSMRSQAVLLLQMVDKHAALGWSGSHHLPNSKTAGSLLGMTTNSSLLDAGPAQPSSSCLQSGRDMHEGLSRQAWQDSGRAVRHAWTPLSC